MPPNQQQPMQNFMVFLGAVEKLTEAVNSLTIQLAVHNQIMLNSADEEEDEQKNTIGNVIESVLETFGKKKRR